MISNDDFKAISDLDLEPIKMKLMHEPSGEGWSAEKANAVELEYRRFLYLMKAFPTEQAAPLVDVDTFWHYHILDTMKYAVDCEQAFGYFVHHYPYVGILGENGEEEREAGGNRMQELYEQTFGDSYDVAAQAIAMAGKTDAAPNAAASRSAYCWIVGPGNAPASKSAYCWFTGPGNAPARSSAYCWITGPGNAPAKSSAYRGNSALRSDREASSLRAVTGKQFASRWVGSRQTADFAATNDAAYSAESANLASNLMPSTHLDELAA